jgi:hypothetical protein
MRTSFFVITLSMLMFCVNNAVFAGSALSPDPSPAPPPTSVSTDLEAKIDGQHDLMYESTLFSDGTLSYGAGVYSGGGDAKSGVSASVTENILEKKNAFATESTVNGTGAACAYTQYGANATNVTAVNDGGITVTNSNVQVTSSSSSVSR